jgi:predicted HicB family RNase H-like nuclease
MIDASNYNITVRKGWFDGEHCYEARVAELPDVAEYADSVEEAYALAIDTIEVTAEMLAAQGKAMPAPMIPADDYSGRVTLRLAKSLHRSLAQAADKEGVSLNQHLTNILNYYAGYAQAREERNSRNMWYSLPMPQAEKRQRPSHLRSVSTSSAVHEPALRYG